MNVPEPVRSVVAVVQERNITFLAASFAYYAFVSLFPLVLLVLSIGTLLGGQEFSNMLIDAASRFLSDEGVTILNQTLKNSSGSAGASIVSVVILLWSALKLFRGLVIAFEEVYQKFPDVGIVEQVKKGLATLLAVVLGIALMIVVGTILGSSLVTGIPFVGAIASSGLVLGLVFVFLPLYYVLPPVKMSVREALPGTLFAALGWLVLQAGFQYFLGGSGKYGLTGILGVIIVFLTWLYFAGVILLVGAVVNLVVADRGAATL